MDYKNKSLGVEGSKFIDQLAASVVGGRDRGSMARKGVVKGRLLLIVSETTQVAIPWRGCLASSSSLEIEKREGARGSRWGVTDPQRWRWDGACMRLRI